MPKPNNSRKTKTTEESMKEAVPMEGSKSEKGRPTFRGSKRAVAPKRNDWRFYAATEQIAKDVASLPFNYLGGTKFPTSGVTINTQGQLEVVNNTSAIPAVLNVNYVNSIGVTTSKTQGINMAAIQLYTYVRQRNSGASNYEAPDLAMYILALRELYSELARLKKIIGLAGKFDYYNHNIPDLLLLACGVDANDLRNNLAQYRARLNLLISKADAFALPSYFKIIDRSYFIEASVFMDSNSIRGQFYNFNKRGYYVWSPVSSTTGTELVFKQTTTQTKFSYHLDQAQEMLDAMYLDSDALLMSGDILKAFGESGLMNMTEVPENYVTPFVYDEDILSQIENSYAIKPSHTVTEADLLASVTDAWNITQSNQLIKFEPKFKVSTSEIPGYVTKFAFNSHKENPDYKDVLEWSRLMCTMSAVGTEAEGMLVSLTSTGLEVVLSYSLYGYVLNSPQNIANLGSTINGIEQGNSLNSALSITNFDWHPFLYAIYVQSVRVVGDLKVATAVDADTIQKINDAAIYGALYDDSLYSKAKG